MRANLPKTAGRTEDTEVIATRDIKDRSGTVVVRRGDVLKAERETHGFYVYVHHPDGKVFQVDQDNVIEGRAEYKWKTARVSQREKMAYMRASPHQREVVRRSLLNVLACLRAQYLSYQTSHWVVVGQSSYGNHLLFQKLYESVQIQVDELAEKIIGYLGNDAMSLTNQVKIIEAYCARWYAIHCNHRRGVQSEEDLQTMIKMAYDSIKGVGAMTLGLDDWLMATANAHETNSYLLQQSLEKPSETEEDSEAENTPIPIYAQGPPPPPLAPSSEGAFHLPESAEVREFAETGAISNDPSVAADAAVEDNLDIPPAEAVAEALAAPPTPTEIVEAPGGGAMSTLNRFVVQSEEPSVPPAPGVSRFHMADWVTEVRTARAILVWSGDSLSPLGYSAANKLFSIFASDIRGNFLGGVAIENPRKGTRMNFIRPKAFRDRENEITHWILQGSGGITLQVWND
jgi:DNA-binding ferritin-like protein